MKLAIALPVLNEEMVLRSSVERLLDFMRDHMPEADSTLVIADNGSDDRTEEIGRRMATMNGDVEYVRLSESGKGLAVLAAWGSVPADVYAFMDIDLSTDLSALPELCDIAFGSGGLAVGSRFHKDSEVTRSALRRIFSRCYRLLLCYEFGTSVTDAPCGFKAISSDAYEAIVPQVSDRRWFFDTELVIRAERAGISVREIPVLWQEKNTTGRRSRVNVPKLAWEYFRQVRRLKKDLK